MPVDPVCGIELDVELAVPEEYNGKNFIFVVMDADKYLSKNLENIKITKSEMHHTFDRI